MSLKKHPYDNVDTLALLSPYEMKNVLVKVACEDATMSRPADTAMLNAGRGNPNFLATIPRHAFFQLGLFAMRESERSFAYLSEGIGGFPRHEGIEERFELFARENKGVDGIAFLRAAVSYVGDQLSLHASQFLYEMCEGILGCNYPTPARMLSLAENIVADYLCHEMSGVQRYIAKFDLFAVEGGTAAMTHIFTSLRANYLLEPGDTIALATPIFTPYLEILNMSDYQLEVLNIRADKNQNWQYPTRELDKLRDPKVKAFFLVNPSNPTSMKIDDHSLNYIASIVAERPNLMIFTDEAYCMFADQFVSLFTICPKNTILAYSYSKSFGATGWRLGVIGIHHDNVFDAQIAVLPTEKRKALDARYKSIVSESDSFKFIDRLVADSRLVALNHTSGLSTPQQVQMVLFSLFILINTSESYKTVLKRLIRHRKHALYRAINIDLGGYEDDVNAVSYYVILDLDLLCQRIHTRKFATWLLSRTKEIELLFRLARESHVVLMSAHGFQVQHPSVRVSLANVNEGDYKRIGQAVRTLIEEYIEQFNAENHDDLLVKGEVVVYSGKYRHWNDG